MTTLLANAPSPVTIRTESTVLLRRHCGGDADVVETMLASTRGLVDEPGDLDAEATAGRIGYLMRNRHGSPFEHGFMRFYIEAPIFVAREFMRHRAGWSYNEMSGRYRALDGVFWAPGPDRPLHQVGRPGHYKYEMAAPLEQAIARVQVTAASWDAFATYESLLKRGIAREVARAVLPVNTFTAFHASCNPRSLMHFLSLRTRDERAAFPSAPQQEIAEVAAQMEAALATHWPITYAAFNEAGRVAP